MATRRLRPEDWAPVPQTRIQIRAAPLPQGSLDEHAESSECAQKPRRPAPIKCLPGESPPIPQSRESLEGDSPRAPEIVDFAAPSTWPRLGLPSHIAFQQQQRGVKRVGTPSSVSQYSARQSEMSFGILDYYIRDPSPTRSPILPPTPKLPQISQRPPKISTPVIDPAMEKFNFGLDFGSQRPTSQAFAQSAAPDTVIVLASTTAGVQNPSVDDEATASPTLLPKTEKSEQVKAIYSLFPKDTSPPSHPSLTSANRQDSSPPQDATASSTIVNVPSHQQLDPSYRPRKESLTSSLRSRKDSFTFYRANAQRIPLRVLSASSSSAYTTPRTSNAIPFSIHTTRTSSSTASPPHSSNSSNARSQSRWSEDTITSPTVAAFQGRRASFGSLLRSVDDEPQSGQYPACFFEDDDDEVVPLRRKLHWARSVSLQGQQQGRRTVIGSGEWEGESLGGRKGNAWRKWVLCGCGG